MNDIEFAKSSRETAQAIAAAVEARIANIVNSEAEIDIPDAIKVFEAMHKRLGSFQQEKQDSQMVVHWNINGGNVSFNVETAPQAPAVDTDVTDVTPKELASQEPAADNSAVFTLALQGTVLSPDSL
jgi:hypothetical protein